MVKNSKNKNDSSAGSSNEKKTNYMFLLIFFGMVIVIQLAGIALRNFQANTGQLIGIGIGLIGYALITASYIKEKKKKVK